MLNVGAGEVIVIALILLIAVGPEQLPGLIRRVGRTVAEVRGMTEGLRSEFMSGLDEIERATDPEAWAAASGPTNVKPRTTAVPDDETGSDAEKGESSDLEAADSGVGGDDDDAADAEAEAADADADAADAEAADAEVPDHSGLNSFLKPSIAYQNPIAAKNEPKPNDVPADTAAGAAEDTTDGANDVPADTAAGAAEDMTDGANDVPADTEDGGDQA